MARPETLEDLYKTLQKAGITGKEAEAKVANWKEWRAANPGPSASDQVLSASRGRRADAKAKAESGQKELDRMQEAGSFRGMTHNAIGSLISPLLGGTGVDRESGWLDELQALNDSLEQKTGYSNDPYPDATFGERFDKNRAKFLDQHELEQEMNPISTQLAAGTGLVAPMLSGLGAVPEVSAAQPAVSRAAPILKNALKAGAIGTVLGAGSEEGGMESRLGNAAVGGVLGTAVGAAIPALSNKAHGYLLTKPRSSFEPGISVTNKGGIRAFFRKPEGTKTLAELNEEIYQTKLLDAKARELTDEFEPTSYEQQLMERNKRIDDTRSSGKSTNMTLQEMIDAEQSQFPKSRSGSAPVEPIDVPPDVSPDIPIIENLDNLQELQSGNFPFSETDSSKLHEFSQNRPIGGPTRGGPRGEPISLESMADDVGTDVNPVSSPKKPVTFSGKMSSAKRVSYFDQLPEGRPLTLTELENSLDPNTHPDTIAELLDRNITKEELAKDPLQFLINK